MAKETKKRNKVVEILMNRDGLTEREAKELLAETREALNNGDFSAIEDYLGLEDDYIFDIIQKAR